MNKVHIETFDIPRSDPLTLSNHNQEELEAFTAGLLTLIEENQDGKSRFGGAMHRIQRDEMTLEAIMIRGLLAQKNGRHLHPIKGELLSGTAIKTNVVQFTGRRKRNRRD